jgi:hypothetical protein
MYISNSNTPIDSKLIIAHESQHVVDTYGRTDNLGLFDRIVLEERARVSETEIWEKQGRPQVTGQGRVWELQNPKKTGWLQGVSDWLDELAK